MVAPVPLWATTVLGALPVAEFGSDALRAGLLPGVVAGQVVLTAALADVANDLAVGGPGQPAVADQVQRVPKDRSYSPGLHSPSPSPMWPSGCWFPP